MAAENKITLEAGIHKLSGLLLGVMVLFALFFNLSLSWRAYGEVPLREAASRSLMAAGSGYFYDSGLAEPLPVFALKAAILAASGPAPARMAEGLAVFTAITVLTLVLLLRRYGVTAGLMGALLVAANPYLGYYAVQGDTHIFALFFLLLFWHYFDPEKITPRRAAWAGLYGGLACLSRLDSAWFLLLSAGMFAALHFRAFNYKAAGLSLGLALLLVSPYLAWQRAHYKNAFYAQELSLRRWANLDRYRHNAPGPVTTAPLSVAGFIFRDGPAGALRGAFSGLGRSLSYEVPRVIYYKAAVVLVFLGFYAAFVLKKDALLVFSAAAFLPVLAFAPIDEIASIGGITLRYYLWPLWAFCALAGVGFQEALNWGDRRVDEWLEKKAGAGPAKQG